MGTFLVSEVKPGISPWFINGQLRYTSSGHSLTCVNGNYVCSMRQKSKCLKTDEKNIACEDLEAKFSEYVQSMKLFEPFARGIYESVCYDFIPTKVKFLKIQNRHYDNMQTCIDAIERDWKNTKKYNNRVITDFKYYYSEALKATYALYLLTIDVQGTFKTLCKNDENDFSFWISLMSETVYISDDGEIDKIKFEDFPDYIFQFIKTRVPDFLNSLKIVRSTEYKEFNFVSHIEKLYEADFRGNTYSYSAYVSGYEEKKQLDGIFKGIKTIKGPELLKALRMYQHQSKTVAGLVNNKFEHKNQKCGLMIDNIKKMKRKYGKNVSFTGVGLKI